MSFKYEDLNVTNRRIHICSRMFNYQCNLAVTDQIINSLIHALHNILYDKSKVLTKAMCGMIEVCMKHKRSITPSYQEVKVSILVEESPIDIVLVNESNVDLVDKPIIQKESMFAKLFAKLFAKQIGGCLVIKATYYKATVHLVNSLANRQDFCEIKLCLIGAAYAITKDIIRVP
jgi:hypothetical protein